jgi:pyrimidine-nucleoside phosphorylase
MDVKVGRGAFMKTLPNARALAKSIVSVGRAAGLKTSALITTMDQPLGMAIGNALEIREAIELLHGKGAPDLLECTLALGAEMLMLAKKAKSRDHAREQLQTAIDNLHGAGKLRSVILAQGGNARVIEEPDRLPSAPLRVEVKATRAGYVKDIDALVLGKLAMELGAGRKRTEDVIDTRVGIALCVKPGTQVKKGTPLCVLHVAAENKPAIAIARAAFELGARPGKPKPVVIERIS